MYTSQSHIILKLWYLIKNYLNCLQGKAEICLLMLLVNTIKTLNHKSIKNFNYIYLNLLIFMYVKKILFSINTVFSNFITTSWTMNAFSLDI